ncbi:prolipoprotein diacylglyceryl transferase [Paracnuella aquatica]|uniref:prolipoprotein diacylglyceryl transferase n=1 Tax=Paracnuella aquatica TaxID=2268757 RepID=UPI000DEF5817|nr:prolipoprotein diacylglyceryl transferase family protein [Paracnuella aquatica]RPD51351.1 diacylglyceryl transferase [Paracnuella aquatica]
MYPNLYYAFKDLFGLEIGPLRFINSFGFFVAIAFFVAAALLTSELKRKSKLGLLQPTEDTVTVGEPASTTDLLLNFLLGFVLGYKILGMFFLGPEITADPQAYIFSGAGSWPLGLLLGGVFAFLKWREKQKTRLEKPEKRKVRLWPQDRVGEITLLALVFGLLGAKLFDIFENWSEFLKRPMDFILSGGGLTFYGGLICATIAIIIFARKHKIPLRHLADSLAPALMIAYAIGRIGCQVAGDGDWGIENTDPNPFSWLPDWVWSYNYPHNVNEVGVPIPGCEGRYCAQLPVGHYPTPFYETVACMLLFGVLWVFRKRLKTPGALFALYLILNGLERFFIEKIRVNNRLDFLGFQPTQAEVISTCLIFIGIGLWIYLSKKNSVQPVAR